jgi:hypothetical protein
LRFSASLAVSLDFKIENDRNTRAFEQKINMHISEIAKSSGKGGPREACAERATHDGSKNACHFNSIWGSDRSHFGSRYKLG